MMDTDRLDSTFDPLELLKRINPVLPARREKLARELKPGNVVDQLIRDDRRQTFDDDLRRRRRRRPLPFAIAIASLAAFSLIIGSALGLGPSIISFEDAPEPIQPVKTVIFDLAGGAPPGMDPGLIPDKARTVTTMRVGGASRDLWAAPTRAGGMCYGWVGYVGGCDRFGTIPLNASMVPTSDQQSVALILGYIHTRYASGVEVEFRDGEVHRPLLVKVSDPINAAFFSYDVPAKRQSSEETVVTVRAVDSDGKTVTQQVAPLQEFGPPDPIDDALVAQRKAEIRITSRTGEAIVWTAPTRYGGRCAWLEVEREWRFLSTCRPARYGFDPFGIRPVVTEDNAFLAGTVGSTFASVVLRFADGARTEIHPTQGFLLYELPTTHLQPGHELREVIGVGDDGKEITRLHLRSRGCFAAVPTQPAQAPSCQNDVIEKR